MIILRIKIEISRKHKHNREAERVRIQEDVRFKLLFVSRQKKILLKLTRNFLLL